MPYIMQMIKFRGMRGVGHVAHSSEMTNSYRVLVGNVRQRDYLEYLYISGRILEMILKKSMGERGMD
jgi:hypothetical protein